MKLLFTLSLIVLFSCQKECPPPCEETVFADVKFKEVQGVDYSLRIGEIPVDSWKGDTTIPVRSFDVTSFYEGLPLDFRIRAYLPGKYVYSDVYRDSVKMNAPERVELPAQNGSGSIWVRREGGKNRITVRNSLNCRSRARLIYNGKDTVLNLAQKSAGTEGGTDYVFENRDSVFNISFQLLDPCEYWLTHDVLRVTSETLKPFEFRDVNIKVRK